MLMVIYTRMDSSIVLWRVSFLESHIFETKQVNKVKNVLYVLIMMTSVSQAIDPNANYTYEEYLAMSEMDKALVVTGTRSDVFTNRSVIEINHNQVIDITSENFDMINRKAIDIDINSKRVGVNRDLIDNMQPGIKNSYANTAKIKKLKDKVKESVALSSAFSALPGAYKGESVIGAGVGYFSGESAVAVGIEHSTGTWSLNAGVSSTKSVQAYKAGLGYHW